MITSTLIEECLFYSMDEVETYFFSLCTFGDRCDFKQLLIETNVIDAETMCINQSFLKFMYKKREGQMIRGWFYNRDLPLHEAYLTHNSRIEFCRVLQRLRERTRFKAVSYTPAH